MTDNKVDQVIDAVDDLAFSAMNYQSYYRIYKKMLASSRFGIIVIKNTKYVLHLIIATNIENNIEEDLSIKYAKFRIF